ncbi:uncharacterized protein LOC129457351 [Periophthalmus magnuspinnatus]|uniref:uncharacterized protein LOC129457351 n=1 Tax=Periophthalmus magnuspinnatus TaxID=409849 RepID=UPI002436409A|nr:uncharacterized protein LOC129457351 [Periophthalmus magnuspinnatus]
MGKPLSRPGCFRKSSCCLEKHGFGGDVGVGGRDIGIDGGYGDGYVPQRSIYDTMCINQQIDSHHHHHGGSVRCDAGSDSSFYSTSGSLRISRGPGDMFDQQPRSLTPNPSFVRRLDERAIFDSLKLEGHDIDAMCLPSGDYRSVSPAMSSFSAPGISSSSSKKHHHHHHLHHHGDSTKSRESRHSWKVVTPPKQMECMEMTTADMLDRGGGAYLNPGHYPPSAGQNSSLTSPLISPFSGSPLSSGYHTPVFFSPAKPRPSQTQSLRCSPPHIMQPSRHYSQTQSLRMSPPHELRRSPYRAQLVQLSAHDLEQDLRDRGGGGGGGWGRNERDWEREREREREREMERGWAQREWERERERGRLERERARERERRENSFGTFGYGRPVPLRSDRDSVFLEPDPMLDTTPLLLPQPSPSPSPSGAPRMGTGAVGRNRAGSKVGPDCLSGGMVLVDGKPSCLPRLVSEICHVSDADMMPMQDRHRAESWSKHNNGSRSSFKNEVKMGSQVKTRPIGRDLEGRVQSGMQVERASSVVNHRDSHRGKSMDMCTKISKTESIPEFMQPTQPEIEKEIHNIETTTPPPNEAVENETPVETIKQVEDNMNKAQIESDALVEATPDPNANTEEFIVSIAEPVQEEQRNDIDVKSKNPNEVVIEVQKEETENALVNNETANETTDSQVEDKPEKKSIDIDKIDSKHVHKGSKSHKHKSSKSKSSSRSRPGTATGSRPGVLSRGLRGLESPTPADGIESTWPRRMMVRKRTVRQGGALHNLPILPPLPSVLTALEKRRPHGQHQLHHSENPLSNITNSTGIVGRCSLKEPSHFEMGQGISPVGRASLKEQNLESWRVVREQDDSQKPKGREKSVEKEPKKPKESVKEDRSLERPKQVDVTIFEKENFDIHTDLIKEIKQDVPEISLKIQHESKLETQVQMEQVRDVGVTICEDLLDQQDSELEEVVAKFSIEEPDIEPVRYRDEGDSWDDVLGIVNTLWDEEGWEKRGGDIEGEGDADSLSGSLQRWPLLRPPIGFGGSHPPSSAASELSLTELERRARELDSDLEHLDLSQPHRETEELYPTLHDSRERGDMYQTHPGPQRDKTTAMTGK